MLLCKREDQINDSSHNKSILYKRLRMWRLYLLDIYIYAPWMYFFSLTKCKLLSLLNFMCVVRTVSAYWLLFRMSSTPGLRKAFSASKGLNRVHFFISKTVIKPETCTPVSICTNICLLKYILSVYKMSAWFVSLCFRELFNLTLTHICFKLSMEYLFDLLSLRWELFQLSEIRSCFLKHNTKF